MCSSIITEEQVNKAVSTYNAYIDGDIGFKETFRMVLEIHEQSKKINPEARKLLVFLAQEFRSARAHARRTLDIAPSEIYHEKLAMQIQAWNTFQAAKQIAFHGESIAPAVFRRISKQTTQYPDQTKNHDFLGEFVLNSMQEYELITGSRDNCGLSVLFSMGSLLSKALIFVNSEKPWLQCDDERNVPSHLNWVLAKQGDHEALVRTESYQNGRHFEALIPVPIGRFITNIYKDLSLSEILTMLTQIKDSMIKHLSDDKKSIIEITYVDYVKLLLE
jgi:hypothetical protein